MAKVGYTLLGMDLRRVFDGVFHVIAATHFIRLETPMIFRMMALALLWSAVLSANTVAAPQGNSVNNIVLVHGAFVDGSGWRAVADILRKDGFMVSVVQQPMTSLEEDVVATTRILDRQSGPTVLVGHSYGGVVITEAGKHANVVSLVYVAAYAPDDGEHVRSLRSTKPPLASSTAPTVDGYLLIDRKSFHADFAADIPAADAQFMALAQMPTNAKAFATPVTLAAWKTKPSYGIVATQDRMINPDLERTMYARAKAKVTEVKASHAVLISQPRAVALVIKQAAREAK
jgi:pimeloyl-ACP methyl ester carboxylesterase